MGLLAPWFLAGIAALGLPVWLHLLRKHRSNPLPFSSLMFFERRTQSSIKHRRLQYLLLFALRLALLALIVLAFANPYLKTSVAAAPGRGLLVLAIDQSFSMRAGDRLARAKREAEAQLRAGRRTQVIAFSSQAHVLTQPIADPTALRAAIESIEPTDSRSSYGELVRVLRLLPREAMDIHLFSDLQKTSLPPAFADLRLPPAANLTFHPAASGATPNWTVESVAAPARVYDARPVRIAATIASYSAPAASRRVSLVLNNRVADSRDATLSENGRAAVEFAVRDVPHGLNRAELRLEPPDAFAGDDHFWFSVERADPRQVLFVHNAGATRDLLYFRAALEAGGGSPFQIEEARPEQLGSLDPGHYAFVVLSDISSISEHNLKLYVSSGGALWLALGPNTRRLPLLPNATLRDHFYSSDYQTAAGRWPAVKFYQAIEAAIPGATVSARLGDGTPILQEASLGLGRILIFGSTLDNISNDFPLHASFVPFIEQTASYLAGLDTGASSFTVDSYLQLRAARERGIAIEVLDPEGRRALSLHDATTADSLPLERSGFYEVHRKNGRKELVAVNPDRRESDLARIPADTLALWQHTATPPSTGPSGSAPGLVPRPLWRYILIAAILLAIAESLLGNAYLRSEPQRELHQKAAA